MNLNRLSTKRIVGFARQLPWALAAMSNELFRFRFSFPIDTASDAGRPGSLRYHIHADSLFSDHLSRDENGVVVREYRAQGRQYNPVFIAWSALMSLERHWRNPDPGHLDFFGSQARWLKANAITRSDGASVWPFYFDWQEGRCQMKAPWISAMSQGLGISVLVRNYRLTQDRDSLTICEQAASVFERGIEEGGVRTQEGTYTLYEEYPGRPLARVLDGFLFSLLGLYDLAEELESKKIRHLFEEGVEGLKFKLADWDYREKWSWYGAHGYLCPPHYHYLNGTLLRVLGRLTNDDTLIKFGTNWGLRSLSALDKMEIFSVFAVSKNLARLRLPRN